jgi:hypothetical protein
MMCAKEFRLKQAYDKAFRAWSSSWDGLMCGARTAEASSAFRRQILDARLKAANALYDHSLQCAECKEAKSWSE